MGAKLDYSRKIYTGERLIECLIDTRAELLRFGVAIGHDFTSLPPLVTIGQSNVVSTDQQKALRPLAVTLAVRDEILRRVRINGTNRNFAHLMLGHSTGDVPMATRALGELQRMGLGIVYKVKGWRFAGVDVSDWLGAIDMALADAQRESVRTGELDTPKAILTRMLDFGFVYVWKAIERQLIDDVVRPWYRRSRVPSDGLEPYRSAVRDSTTERERLQNAKVFDTQASRFEESDPAVAEFLRQCAAFMYAPRGMGVSLWPNGTTE